MKIWKEITNFVKKYNPDTFWETFEKIFEYLIETLKGTGNIYLKALLTPLALLLITFLTITKLLKVISKNLYSYLRYVSRITGTEAKFYFRKLNEYTKTVKDHWNNLFLILLAIVNFLYEKILDDDAKCSNPITSKFWGIIGKTSIWTTIHFLFSIVTIISVSILSITTITALVPLLHQWIRILISKKINMPSTNLDDFQKEPGNLTSDSSFIQHNVD